jgi:tetratricopeptide (TPR) repeat protein
MLNKILGDSAVKPFTLHDRILTEPRVLLWYLRLILFPFPKYLSLWHDFTLSKSLSDPWTTFASVFLIFIMLDVAVIMAREWRVFSFAVLWYLGSLLVEALPLPIDLVQEHRVYVASLGLMAPLIAWPGLKAGRAASVFLIIAIVLSVLSFERNRAWATEETLWRDALTKAPSTYRPWDTYCETLRKAGRNAFPTPICKTTPRPKEEQAEEHFNLGIGYLATQQYGLAETEFQAALQIEPANFKYLGNLGACYLLMGKYELAEQALLKAVEIKPDYSYAHRNLAGLFWVTGKIELAGNELLKAAEFNGQVSKDDYLKNTLTELARAIASQGKCGETVKKIKESNARSGVFANFESVCQEESGQIIKTKQ